MSRGQTSLEFLLVVTALFSIFLLFFPLLEKSFSAGIFALNIQKADRFLENLRHAGEKSVLFQTTFEFSEKTDSGIDWLFECSQNKLFLTIIQLKTNFEKELSIDFIENLNCSLPARVNGKFNVEIFHANNVLNVLMKWI